MAGIHRANKKFAIEGSIFKAYDIRGVYPAEINEVAVAAIARAFCVFLGQPKKIVMGRDVRLSGPSLFRSASEAVLESGVDVIDIGIVSADVYYYAAATLDVDGGIFISASHNPREWNGLKISKRGGDPVSSDTGLFDIYELAVNGKWRMAKSKGGITKREVLDDYLDFIYKLRPIENPRPMKIVINGNFGISAQIFRRLAEKFNLPFEFIGLNDNPDGNFPKGPPNPLLLSNREETSGLVVKSSAELGIAWDADGDRIFFVDEKGNFVEGYFATAILAGEMLRENRGATIVADPRLVWATRDVVEKAGGKFFISRPGGTIFAESMKREGAVFGGEMSGHFYFRDTFNRDSGMLPALILLNLMFRENRKLSEIAGSLAEKYFISGEINFRLSDRKSIKELLQKLESMYEDGKTEHIDGLSVEYPRWRFNLRASNTEPLLRLNVEAKSKQILDAELKKLISLIGADPEH